MLEFNHKRELGILLTKRVLKLKYHAK